MRTFWNFVGVVVAAVALISAVALLVSGYWLHSAGLGLIVLAALALAALPGRSKPAPAPAPIREWLAVDEPLPPELSAVEEQMLRLGYITDPVDLAAAQMAHPLGIRRPDWPERQLLEPRHPHHPCHRRDH